MSHIELVLFDLDGTLCDTAPDVHDSVNMALEKMDLPPVSLDQTMKAIGPGPGIFSRIILGEKNLDRYDEYIHIFRPIYHDRCLTKTRLFDGIDDLIDGLHDRSIKVGMVTNKPLPGTTIILKGLDRFDRFDTIICADMVEHPKPDPDMVYKACQKIGVLPEQTMLIGDTDNDILSANNAGAYSCLAGWGYSSEKDNLEMISDFRVEHPMQVLDIVDRSDIPIKKCI